ncbi:single-stranded DNA-binding protein, partial [mine drainage metagenome]
MSANSASEHANADHATCPTCGRPIRAAPAPVSPGIASLRPNTEAFVEATVASVGPTREVDTTRGPAEVADAMLQDATGSVKLVLWGPQIGKVQAGQRVKLAGAWVKEYRGTAPALAGAQRVDGGP